MNRMSPSRKDTMTPATIIQILETKNRMLTTKNDEYPELAEARAQAEREYKMMVREQILRHKTEGHPATLILKLVDGHKVVSELKFKMDVAEAMVKANIESTRSIVNQIDTARSILSWFKQELGR